MTRLRLQMFGMAAAVALTGSAAVFAAQGDGAQPGTPARVEMTDDGPVFVTPAGMTLYTFGADDTTPGKSQCSDVPVKDMADPTAGFGRYPLPGYKFIKSCVQVWPPYMADAHAQPSGDWTLTDRKEGKQWSFRGHPLYLTTKDKKPGDRNGILMNEFARRGFQIAAPPSSLPPGLGLTRDAETLVLAANGRPLYTPHGNRVRQASISSEGLFEPVAAPFVAQLSGDWKAVEAGAGRLQYSYKGKPLYAPPQDLSDQEIDESGAWDKIVYRKLAGHPSEVDTRFTPLGDVYTDKGGRTLYTFYCTGMGCDEPGGPAGYLSALCGGDPNECSRRWHLYRPAAGARNVGEWSVIEIPEPLFTDPAGIIYPPDVPKVKAWAYRGRPVFTYYQDKESGDIMGHMLRWFALSGFNALKVPGRELPE